MPGIERVLQVHTHYRQAGGEEQVVAAEQRLLEAAGVSVRQVLFDNAELRESRSIGGDLRLAASTIWSRSAERRVRHELRAFRPQVMHVHNTFAAASPSVYAAAAAARVPVVQTLHNYRLVCPAAIPFRDGQVCTDCVGRLIPWPGVVHGCVRGSRAQSAVVAAMLVTHRARGTFRRQVHTYLALTAFQRDVLVRGGLPAARIRVVPNFLEPDPGVGGASRSGILFVGRLSVEKGIAPLLEAAARVPGVVRVAGDGPLAPQVSAASTDGIVDHLGSLDRAGVLGRMREALAVVLPSTSFEGFPIVVLEAYAAGTPVIASRIGSLGEVVEDGVTGLHVEPGVAPGLAERLRWAVDHPKELRRLGDNARARYETAYRGQHHLAALLDAYQAAVRRMRAQADA